jgi:hypothetical protein
MIRKEALKNIRYREGYPCAEDYKLWRELAMKEIRFANIPEVLLRYRVSPTQVTRNRWEEMSESVKKIQVEYTERIMEQIVEKNERYETVLNPLIELTNKGLISRDSFKQIVSRMYLDVLETNAQ